MLVLRSLTVENFGPFRDEQRIEFPERGVTIIYGGNGRGKTTLLNAMRYALFGHVLGRGNRPESLAGFANVENSAAGSHRFRVVLEFDADAVAYRLTRHVDIIGETVTERTLLARNETLLGPQEAKAELTRLLPEQIARFFLFDGELLQQYEELLYADSEAGERLKEAIERILGVPVLMNARTDLAQLLGNANREVGRAAEGDARTRQIGLSLQQTQDELDARRTSAEELRARVEDLEVQRDELESRLAGTERTQRLLGERDQLRSEHRRLSDVLDEARRELETLTAVAWRAVMSPVTASMLARLETDLAAAAERRNRAIVTRELRSRFDEARRTGRCPTCGQSVDHAPDEPQPMEPDALDLESIDDEIARIRGRREVLRRLQSNDPSSAIAAVQRRLDDAEVALADVNAELEVRERQLTNVEEADLRSLAQRYAATNEALANGRRAFGVELEEIARRESTIEALRAQLRRVAGSMPTDAQERAALLAQLEALFAAAITAYRERLRVDVEREATTIFRMLSQEPDYERLRINDQYGLTIVHRDGSDVARRSAGFEHLVALALTAGLQRCAPIRGPIIMDSPFGRLDADHKRNVVRTLPMMSEQVVLLVYEDELDRQAAIQELQGDLQSEKVLERVTARHTSIEDRR